MTSSGLAVDFTPLVAGKRRVFCCHGGRMDPAAVLNSVEAVAASAAAGAARVEVDIQFLADETVAVFHDAVLGREGDAHGRLSEFTAAGLRAVTLAAGGHIPLLGDIVDVLRGTGTRLQLDLKSLVPVTAAQRRALEDVIAPVREEVLLGSRAYWSLRAFADSGIPLAFDPTLLLCRFEGIDPPGGIYPARYGTHGFWDDHPLAQTAGVAPRDYLAARTQDFLACLPSAVEWMVNVDTLIAMAAYGFELGNELEPYGIELAVWTVSDSGPGPTTALLGSLISLGATVFITDHPVELARYAASLS